jgi:hypothetical protein
MLQCGVVGVGQQDRLLLFWRLLVICGVVS